MAGFSVWLYEKIYGTEAPAYVADYSFGEILIKPIRKWMVNTVAANCPFNGIRIGIYRLFGFQIGKHTFIGMKCYLDDHCRKEIVIGNNVTVSYGVFFACHGKRQPHTPIIIQDGAYIGMRSNIVSGKKGVTVGNNATVGAGSLVMSDIPAGSTAVGVPCRVIAKSEGNCGA